MKLEKKSSDINNLGKPKNFNLLIISYHFPPDSSVGRLRAYKFAKYLPEFGYKPIIMTVKSKYYDYTQNRSEDISKMHIERTFIIPSIGEIYFKLKRFIPLQKKPGISKTYNRTDICKTHPDVVKRSYGSLSKLKSSILSLANLPDNKIGWVPIGILKGFYLIKKYKIRSIFTTSPPHSTHLIGYFLKKIARCNWIADFRDPWTIDKKNSFKYIHNLRTKFTDFIESSMEKVVIDGANKVTCITPELTKAMKLKYLHDSDCKNKILTNYAGFDPMDLAIIDETKKRSKFKIAYAGNFFLKRNPYYFLEAINKLIEQNIIPKKNIEIEFIGPCKYHNGISVEKIIEEINLSDIVNFYDVLPYAGTLKKIAQASAALILAPDQPFQIPTKTYELIGLQLPIIALTTEGATKNLLRKYNCAFIAEYYDIESISCCVKKLYKFYESNSIFPKNDIVFKTKFFKRNLTKELVNILNNM